jgi:N4-gp56 family major capsid protein
LDTADILTHTIFARTREDLQTHRAPEWGGGYYVFLMGPTTNAGFMTDTDGGWMGLAQYRGQAMFRGEIGRYMGFRVVQTSQPFRCVLPTTAITGGPGATSSTDYSLTGSNYAENGAGHYSLAFGQQAYGVTKLPGYKKPKIIVHPPGSAGSADPLNRQGTIGWYIPFVPCALNALWCISVVSGG